MIKHKNKIITGFIIIIILAFVFWYGGDAPGLRGWVPKTEETSTTVQHNEPEKDELKESEKTTGDTQKNIPATEENKPQKQDGTSMTPDEKIALAEKIAEESLSTEKNQDNSEKTSVEIKKEKNKTDLSSEDKNATIQPEPPSESDENQKTSKMSLNSGKDEYLTDPIPEGKPLPIEPQDAVISDKELTCTLSVRCDTILKNIAWLDKEKIDIVPKDGIIFKEKIVTFYEGESVFNLLMREMKRNKIHMEFENTPIYNSAYIEGIANLYEFDCGELSGWMYKVNDWFPNYGCSRYQLKAGDKVEWVYTCDLGIDVGGYYSAKGDQ